MTERKTPPAPTSPPSRPEPQPLRFPPDSPRPTKDSPRIDVVPSVPVPDRDPPPPTKKS